MLDNIYLPTSVHLHPDLRGHSHAKDILLTILACRDIDTDISHPMTAERLSELTGIRMRQTYYALKILSESELLRRMESRYGVYVFDIVFLSKRTEEETEALQNERKVERSITSVLRGQGSSERV